MAENQPDPPVLTPRPRGKKRGAAAVDARRALVARGLKARFSYRQIQDLCVSQGLSRPSISTISGDKDVLVAEWKRDQSADIAATRALDVATLDDAIRSITPKVLGGDLRAAAVLVDVMSLKAKMLGESEPEKRAIGGWEGAAPIPIADAREERVHDLTALSDEDLEFIADIQRRIPGAAPDQP